MCSQMGQCYVVKNDTGFWTIYDVMHFSLARTMCYFILKCPSGCSYLKHRSMLCRRHVAQKEPYNFATT